MRYYDDWDPDNPEFDLDRDSTLAKKKGVEEDSEVQDDEEVSLDDEDDSTPEVDEDGEIVEDGETEVEEKDDVVGRDRIREFINAQTDSIVRRLATERSSLLDDHQMDFVENMKRLVESGLFPQVSADVQADWAIEAQDATARGDFDEAAYYKTRLWVHNLKLVLGRMYQLMGAEMREANSVRNDALSLAWIWFDKGVDRWDRHRGVKVATWLYKYFPKGIYEARHSSRSKGLNVRDTSHEAKLKKRKGELKQKIGHDPSLEEVHESFLREAMVHKFKLLAPRDENGNLIPGQEENVGGRAAVLFSSIGWLDVLRSRERLALELGREPNLREVVDVLLTKAPAWVTRSDLIKTSERTVGPLGWDRAYRAYHAERKDEHARRVKQRAEELHPIILRTEGNRDIRAKAAARAEDELANARIVPSISQVYARLFSESQEWLTDKLDVTQSELSKELEKAAVYDLKRAAFLYDFEEAVSIDQGSASGEEDGERNRQEVIADSSAITDSMYESVEVRERLGREVDHSPVRNKATLARQLTRLAHPDLDPKRPHAMRSKHVLESMFGMGHQTINSYIRATELATSGMEELDDRRQITVDADRKEKIRRMFMP